MDDIFPLVVVLGLILVVLLVIPIAALVQTTQLKKRVSEIEQRLATLPRASKPQVELAPVQPQPVLSPPPAKPAIPASIPPASVTSPRIASSRGDLERLIGGKWLNWIGIFALLFGTAFFLKLAFDNGWIGPIGRVTIGLLAGTALIGYSQVLFRRKFVYFSEGVAGLGAGVLFLSLYASWNFYHFIPNIAAFAGMAAVTSVLLALALVRDSQRIAVLALVGGFVTPLLLNTGEDAEVQLFGYLALLNAGLLWVAYARNWRALPAAFVFTLIYYSVWYSAHYEESKLGVTVAFSALFFVEFATLPALRALRTGTMYGEQVALALLNTAWFVLAMNTMLSAHRWVLTAIVLLIALAYLFIAQAAARSSGAPLARILYSGLALTLATAAIPIRLSGPWITIAWAIEGAVLIWSGAYTNTRLLRAAGLIVFTIVVVRLIVSPLPGGHPIFNPRFETFAVVIACFGFAAYVASRSRDQLGKDEQTIFSVLQVGINVIALWALTSEVLSGTQAAQQQQLQVTLVWTLYAAALLLLGMRYGSKLLRWQGLVLLGIGIIKVFLFDLSELALGLRILAFMVLGVVLLGVSFLYQRRLQTDKSDGQS